MPTYPWQDAKRHVLQPLAGWLKICDLMTSNNSWVALDRAWVIKLGPCGTNLTLPLVSMGPRKGYLKAVSAHLYRCRQNTRARYVVVDNFLQGGIAQGNRIY